MNNILVNEEHLTINNNIVWLDIFVDKLTITIEGKVIINELTTQDHPLDLTINLTKNSYLIYNRFNNFTSSEKIIINGNENSQVSFNYSFLATTKKDILLNYDQNNNSGNCEINVYALAKDNASLTIAATGHILKSTNDNEYLENIRITSLNNEKHTIYPNLLIDTHNVTASHNATIASVDEEELFYLSTKGLSKPLATKLISQGFLLSIFDENYQTKIKSILDKEV